MLVDQQLMQAVQHCGYERFNIRILGDHQGLYVDFHTRDLFGVDTLVLPPIALQDYCSKHLHQTAAFIQDQYQHLEDHTWFSQIKTLQECIHRKKPNHTLANKLDKRRIEACQYAGRKLKRYGPTPYSPALIKQKTICQLLKLVVHRHKIGMAKDETTLDIYRKLKDIGITTPKDQAECQQVYKNHIRELTVMMNKETQNNTKRQEFQDELINQAIHSGDKDRANRIKRIQ
jgi:hypothetical protein